VNIVGIEDYLRGVVPRESPAWFNGEALKAQAVATRSYALAEGGESGQRFSYAKTCDSTSCQVYGGAGINGVSREAGSTDAAVVQTAGLVRRLGDGSLARTEFSSSSGGWTAGGTFPAVPDDGDAVASNPRHNWQATLSTAAIASAYGVGSFVDLQITQRNGLGEWGGRVLKVSIIGTTKSVSVTGAQFQSDWGLFSTWFTTDASNGPGAVSPTTGRTDVFARGGDGAVWQRTESGAGLGPWRSLGGTITSDPDASSWSANRLDVFARGVDGALWHRGGDGVTWSGWQSLGGALLSGPTAVSWGPNRIDVFAKGTDGALWSKSWNGSVWTNWYSLGGGFIGDPDVASWGGNRLDVFIRGLDSGLWHIAWNGAVWSAWQNLGGLLTAGPGSASWAPNRIDVFSRGGDGAAWGRAWNGSAWTPWYSLGGGLSSDPDLAAPGVGRLDVAARGLDASIWQRSWNGSAWSNWFSLGVPA
jgi:SpoIID/LytB domain protein